MARDRFRVWTRSMDIRYCCRLCTFLTKKRRSSDSFGFALHHLTSIYILAGMCMWVFV